MRPAEEYAVGLYREANKPTFDLVKDEWACTSSHPMTTVSGKSIIVIRRCDRWERL